MLEFEVEKKRIFTYLLNILSFNKVSVFDCQLIFLLALDMILR